ncbi:MAG: hypothetical protein WDN72_05885 [Alphaproteobacteria bacterium]
MSDPTDMARMAQQFLALWQREVTRQMSDPATVSAMMTAMQAFSNTAKKEPDHDGARRPAPAPDAEHDAVRKLSKRVAELERELARLQRVQPVPAETKKPVRAKQRRDAQRVAKNGRAVGRRGKSLAKRRKPAGRKK